MLPLFTSRASVVFIPLSEDSPVPCSSSSLRSVAVGVGFYGNSETNDGVYQLTYSLYNANHTLGGVDSLVGTSSGGFLRSEPPRPCTHR